MKYFLIHFKFIFFNFAGCTGKKVDSVQAAQDLSGCTKIEGALEIRIIKGSE